MATPLTDKINALTSAANETTGASDTTLGDAVATLIEGYGGGGGATFTDFSAGNIQALISHGTEYIVTDYAGSLLNLFSIKFSDDSVTNYEHYFSTAYNNYGTGVQRLNYYWTVQDTIQSTTVLSNRSFTSGEAIVMTICGFGKSSTEYSANLPLAIGAGYYNGSMESQIAAFTFYGLNIMDSNSEFVARYMPWLDDNSVPCVKDLISGTIFYNAGSGTYGYIDSNGTTHDS